MTDKNRNIIITGASRGIGRAIATQLASANSNILVNYNSSEDAAKEVVDEIQSKGFVAEAMQADVSDASDVVAMFDKVEELWGGVDVLVNNAALMKLTKIAEVDDEDFSNQMNINFAGSFYGIREAAKRMNDGGSIVNISTSIVGMSLERYGVYAATKAAVESMTKVLSKELGDKNINVNAVAPGPTKTDLFMEGKSDEFIEELTSKIPLGRLGDPNDIAKVIEFLISENGKWITGQVIRANGGIV